MGWEGRDWAKWSDEERQRVYVGPIRTSRPSDTPFRLRLVLWITGTAAALLATLVLLSHAFPMKGGSLNANPLDGARPTVIYGWRHVPPEGAAGIDPSRLTDRIGGQDVICTARRRSDAGQWVCVEYGIINPGMRVVESQVTSPDAFAPCSRSVAPDGRPIPCPG